MQWKFWMISKAKLQTFAKRERWQEYFVIGTGVAAVTNDATSSQIIK